MLRAKFAIKSEELGKLESLARQMLDEFASLSSLPEAMAA